MLNLIYNDSGKFSFFHAPESYRVFAVCTTTHNFVLINCINLYKTRFDLHIIIKFCIFASAIRTIR